MFALWAGVGGGCRGFLGAMIGFWGLAIVFVATIVLLPGVNPAFVIVPVVVVPVAVMWSRETRRERASEPAPKDPYPT